jgi:plastocyanin
MPPLYLPHMGKKQFLAAIAFALAAATPAFAGTLNIAVTDSDGKPAEEAVVELAPDAPNAAASRVPLQAVIDQRHETFIPLVSLIRKGGHVVFTNNDTTMHEVYSFSTIKQFEFKIDEGQHSEPVVFNIPGVSAIGCNIHDQMITYVYVADSPFAAVTNASGHAVFSDMPAGAYHAHIWHPRLAPGEAVPSYAISISGADQSAAYTLTLMPPPAKRPMHMGGY